MNITQLNNNLQIALLELLAIPQSYKVLINKLNITWLQLFEIIANINLIQNNIIDYQDIKHIQLTREINWLELDIIYESLIKLNLQYNVCLFAALDSTNTTAIANIHDYQNKTIIITEFQTNGRGRSNKVWTSKIAIDLTFSIIYWLDIAANYQAIPLIVALAINTTMQQFAIHTTIKWPNDVYNNEIGKIGGILVESGISNNQRFVVIGVGLDNINLLERNLLLVTLIKHIDNLLTIYYANGFIQSLKQQLLNSCSHYQKTVNIYQNNQLIDSGIHIDIDIDGKIIIASNIYNRVMQYTNLVSLAYT